MIAPTIFVYNQCAKTWSADDADKQIKYCRILLCFTGNGGNVEGFRTRFRIKTKRFGLLDYCEHLIGVYCRALDDSNLYDSSGLGRLDFVLHLHRLDDHYALPERDLIALGEQHSHNFSGHGRDQFVPPLDSVVVSARATMLAVDNLYGEQPTRDLDAHCVRLRSPYARLIDSVAGD